MATLQEEQDKAEEIAGIDEDDILEGITGGLADEDEAADAEALASSLSDEIPIPRDGQGRFTKKDSEEVSSTGDAGAEDSENISGDDSSDTESSASPEYDEEAFRDALKRLKEFDNIPDEVLESTSPDKVIAWGERRRKNHADIRRLQDENATLKKGRQTSRTQDSEGSDEPAEPALDYEKLAEPFKEYLGDDISGPLQGFAKTIVDAVTTKHKSEVENLRSQLDSYQAMFLGNEFKSAREQLRERFPQLNNPAAFERARETAMEIGSSDSRGRYNGVAEVLEAACLQEFGKDIINGLQDQRRTSRQKRANSQPTKPQRNGSIRSEPVTEDEAEDAILRHIWGGQREKALNFYSRQR